MSDPGSGYGDGDGDGYGYGDGDGYGYGDGDGSGYGSGSGYGYGYGVTLGTVGNYDILHPAPWPYLAIGCEVHSVEHWREHWRELAAKHGIDVSQAAVDDVLAKLPSPML